MEGQQRDVLMNGMTVLTLWLSKYIIKQKYSLIHFNSIVSGHVKEGLIIPEDPIFREIWLTHGWLLSVTYVVDSFQVFFICRLSYSPTHPIKYHNQIYSWGHRPNVSELSQGHTDNKRQNILFPDPTHINIMRKGTFQVHSGGKNYINKYFLVHCGLFGKTIKCLPAGLCRDRRLFNLWSKLKKKRMAIYIKLGEKHAF